MISASPVTIFSLCADVTLAIFAVALSFLALWRNVRRRSSQFFALSMFFLGLYGLLNIPLHFGTVWDFNVHALFLISAGVYMAALLTLANFLLTFAGEPFRRRWDLRLMGLPLFLWYLALVARGDIFYGVVFSSNGDYYYRIAPVGVLGIGLAAVYLGAVAVLLWRSGIPRARESAVPVFVILGGLASLSVAARFNFHRYSPNLLSLMVAVIMLGHVLLKYQVFLPLAQLNAELERKKAELQIASRAKAQFLANMSHDLRTPLNSILGYTRVFLAGAYGEPTEAQQERLQRILRNGQHLLEMINDVLDFSRIDAHQLELYRTRVETSALLDALADEFEPQARAKGVALVRGYGELPAVHADEERVRQVVRNLLSNALRHTSSGAIIVRGYYDLLQERVVLSVTDTGTGIPAETQKRLFEPLVPVLVEPSEHPEGIGLGLFITKKLVEMHGGRIWYESAVGQGSTFYVALPTHEIPAYKDVVITPQQRREGRAVLVVSSEPEEAARLQRALEAARLHAYGVACAHTGLQMAHEMRPALLVLVEDLPCAPMGRVLLALHHDPATKHTPVLLLTQDAQPLFPVLPNVRAWLPRAAPPAAVLQKVRALLGEDVTVAVEAAS